MQEAAFRDGKKGWRDDLLSNEIAFLETVFTYKMLKNFPEAAGIDVLNVIQAGKVSNKSRPVKMYDHLEGEGQECTDAGSGQNICRPVHPEHQA